MQPPAPRIPFNRAHSRPQLDRSGENSPSTETDQLRRLISAEAHRAATLQRENADLQEAVRQRDAQISRLESLLVAKDELIARASAAERRLEAVLRRHPPA